MKIKYAKENRTFLKEDKGKQKKNGAFLNEDKVYIKVPFFFSIKQLNLRNIIMDVLSLLIKRAQYEISPLTEDGFLKEAVFSDDNEISIILTENSLNQYRTNGESISALLKKYSLKAVFDIKNPYANTNISFFLYVFSKEWNQTIIYGIYNDVLRHKTLKSDVLTLADEFPETYFSFLDSIEKYCSTDICPDDTIYYEFGQFNSCDREEGCWNPKRYSKAVKKVENALKKELTVPLSEVSAIIRPQALNTP